MREVVQGTRSAESVIAKQNANNNKILIKKS